MICDDCTWGDCESCPLDEHPTNSEIDMLGVGDRGKAVQHDKGRSENRMAKSILHNVCEQR